MTTLSGAERPDLLKDERLHEIFFLTSVRFPNKVALICNDDYLTYSELYDQAFRMSFILHKRKEIGPGSIVGIRLSRSFELHVTILAVLMTGATYVPFDADTPQERVSEVIADLEAVLLLVDSKTCFNHPKILNIDSLIEDETMIEDDNLTIDINVNSAAYIICTSGSTGKPKSIGVTHRNICHLLRADNEIMKIRSNDIVYNGSSAAFDMFFEETFLGYLVGATIVIASKSDVINTDRLHLFFIHHSINILFCVPTLLLLINNHPDLKLRLINIGGEPCSQIVVDRWYREDRLLFNSYGPTETTVSATVILLHPHEIISIGKPLPNYVCSLLDETTGQPTSSKTGELCISGPGVALGYLRRNSLTKQKFTCYGYRTGDRVTFHNGNLFFHERIDSQVKIRGFRIELDEIEEELLRINDQIQSAAVIVFKEHLIAFIVGDLIESQMREALTKRLPHYMIPQRLIKLNQPIPRLISGKIDRKTLNQQIEREEQHKIQTIINISDPMCVAKSVDVSPLEIVLSAFRESFLHIQPNENDDFFVDLGGHSIIAALTVTKLRETFPDMALQDLYECKTAANLAQRVEMKSNMIETNVISPVLLEKATWLRCFVCSVIQCFVLIVVAGVASLEYILPYILFNLIFYSSNLIYGYLGAYGTFVVIPPFRLLLSVIIKWIVIGRYVEGDYPLWGLMYLRWWTVEQFQRLATPEMMCHTPLMSIYYRILGAKIGENVHLGRIQCSAIDLLEIGNGTSISSNVSLQTAFVDDYLLKFRRISIGDNVHIGQNSVLDGESKLCNGCEILDMSFVPSKMLIPSGEVWGGSPVKYVRQTSPFPCANVSVGNKCFLLLFILLILLFLPLIYLIPMIPGLTLFEHVVKFSFSSWIEILIFSPLIGILYTCLVVLEMILLNYLLIRNLKVGIYKTNSLIYIRKWIFDRLCDISLRIIHTFYATLYITPFLRSLGMKIGRRCEVSTATGMIHSLVEIGDESFIADGVILADPVIRHGQISFKKTILGKRVFIGNSAIIADGIEICDNCLIGCMSLVADGLKEGQTCLGSPSIILPRRSQLLKEIPEDLTYNPPLNLILKRFLIDTFRVFLPGIIILFQIGISLNLFKLLSDQIGFGLSLLVLPFFYIFIFAIPSLVICLLLKWILIGKYQTNQYPMWTFFVWTSEFITAIYEQLAVGLALDFLRGTFFLPPLLRCFGVRIGQGCFVNTTNITEFDLVNIGDYVVLNHQVGLQTHLFEDRVMKIDHVVLEDQTTIGCSAIMLPNTKLGRLSKLGPLSLIIKGEGIPTKTSWQGIPIKPDKTNYN